MSTIHIEAERVIDAAPDQVYNMVADYRTTHKNILPPDTYIDYQVEQGGQGAGTVFSYKMKTPMRPEPRAYKMQVSTPTPGSILQESDQNSTMVTTWTVSPAEGGSKSRVRVTVEWESSAKGMGGFMERTFAPGATKRIYENVLARLETEAK